MAKMGMRNIQKNGIKQILFAIFADNKKGQHLLTGAALFFGHNYFTVLRMYAARYSPHAFCVAGPKELSTSNA